MRLTFRKKNHRHNHQSGLSLVELILSNILIGIVMLGVVSIQQATKQVEVRINNNRGVVLQRTAAMLLDVGKNAYLAVGDNGSVAGRGMTFQTGPARYCFRQDFPGTPTNYADDTWVCFDQNQNDLFKCQRASPGACVAANPTRVLIGNIILDGITISNPFITGIPYVQISITNRNDPTLAADPTKNPEVTLTTDVYPLGHSF